MSLEFSIWTVSHITFEFQKPCSILSYSKEMQNVECKGQETRAEKIITVDLFLGFMYYKILEIIVLHWSHETKINDLKMFFFSDEKNASFCKLRGQV